MEEMQSLIASTLSALELSELHTEAQQFHSRILAQPPHVLIESAAVAPNEFRWTLKPIVELLLYDVQQVARDPQLSAEDRGERIRWAIEMAGF
jgi:hypothetical protein